MTNNETTITLKYKLGYICKASFCHMAHKLSVHLFKKAVRTYKEMYKELFLQTHIQKMFNKRNGTCDILEEIKLEI